MGPEALFLAMVNTNKRKALSQSKYSCGASALFSVNTQALFGKANDELLNLSADSRATWISVFP